MLHLVRPASLLNATCFAFILHFSAGLHAFMSFLCVWTCHFDSQQLIIRSPCVVSSVSDLHLLNLMTFRWNLILPSHLCCVQSTKRAWSGWKREKALSRLRSRLSRDRQSANSEKSYKRISLISLWEPVEKHRSTCRDS